MRIRRGRPTAPLFIDRADLILLALPSADDDAARREMGRQLPSVLHDAPWARVGARLFVWPPHRQAQTEARALGQGRIRDGVAVAPNVVPEGTAPLWLVPPQRWTAKRGADWVTRHERILAGLAILLFTAGMVGAHVSTSMDDRLAGLTRERRKIGATMAATSPGMNEKISFLADLAARVPKNAHLVELSSDDSLRTIRLRGRAADYATVTAFQSALGADPRVHNVQPVSASLVKIGSSSVVEFILMVGLR